MRILAVIAIVLAAEGCSCSGETEGGAAFGFPCAATADCAAGLECVGGVCRNAPGTDDGGAFDGPRPDVATGCGDFPFSVTSEPPDLMLLVDRSLSMDDDIPGGGTKWEALLAAVDTVTHALESNVHFGLASYPGDGSGLCSAGDVLIDPAVDNADAIVDRLTRDGTNGATPTAPSLEAVGNYFRMPRADHDGHPPAILLATDGAPNCNDTLDGSSCMCTTGGGGGDCGGGQFCLDDARTYAALDATSGGDPGIPVYVIGLPGTEAFADVLSEMARRGGTARPGDPAYYAAGDGAALETALGEIAAGVVSCVFSMDVAPENPRQVRILLDGMDVPHTDDRSDGWAYTNPENTVFELFGSWCARLTDGGSHTVTARYECTEVF